MKILIDNGHGENTPGKCSPDGRLREYRYTREIAAELERELQARGIDAERIVREEIDVPLKERCRRVNEVCRRLGAKNVALVSIHCNAAPPNDNRWHSARGWCAFTSRGGTKADALATMLYEEAAGNFQGHSLRKDCSDGDPDQEAGFYILNNTKCPAVLTENFFQDNKEDVAWLLSAEGRRAIVKTHADALERYIREYGKI